MNSSTESDVGIILSWRPFAINTGCVMCDARAKSASPVLAQLHPQAEAYYSTRSNIAALCNTLRDPARMISASLMSVELFSPFKPMLGKQKKRMRRGFSDYAFLFLR